MEQRIQSLSTRDGEFRGTSASYSAPIGRCHCTGSLRSLSAHSTQQLLTEILGAGEPMPSSRRGSASRTTTGKYVMRDTVQKAGSGVAIPGKSSAYREI